MNYSSRSPPAFKLAKEWKEQADIARAYLEKASKRMKKWADKKRRPMEFKEGDKVLVKLYAHGKADGLHWGLKRRYDGPFPIIKRVGKVAYKVELPQGIKIHPVFHVSMLKPYREDLDDPNRGKSTRAPLNVRAQYDKEVEYIISHRKVPQSNQPPTTEFLIKWKGLPESEASWEPIRDLWQFEEQIKAYEEKATGALPD